MKLRRVLLLSILCTSLAVLGCGESSEEGGEESGSPESGAEGTGEQDGGTLELDGLGLVAEAPEGAEAEEAPVGDGLMVQGPGLVVQVSEAGGMDAEDLEAAKEDADMYDPEEMEEEELDGGFALTYVNEGSMGKNYFVNVRRTLDGTDYWCETTANEPAGQDNALAFCKSLATQ